MLRAGLLREALALCESGRLIENPLYPELLKFLASEAARFPAGHELKLPAICEHASAQDPYNVNIAGASSSCARASSPVTCARR